MERLIVAPKGLAFVRAAMALGAARSAGGAVGRAEMECAGLVPVEVAPGQFEYRPGRWRDTATGTLAKVKAAVDPGGTQSGNWAENLALIPQADSEFIDVLRPQTIVGRLSGLRTVPFRTQVARATGGASASWVGQGAPKPISALALDTVTLGIAKIVATVVLTEQLLNQSNPAAEATVQRDLVAALSYHLDQQFIDPTVTAVADTNPASITSGATAIPSTGNSVAQITTDARAVLAAAIAAGSTLQNSVWVMHPRTAAYLGSALTAGNAPMWPGVGPRGGTWFGLPVLTSAAVPVDTGDDSYIVLLDPTQILFAQGPIALDVSRHASVEMDSAPSGGAQQLVSLWQENLVGLRAEMFVNWQRATAAAAVVLEDVSY